MSEKSTPKSSNKAIYSRLSKLIRPYKSTFFTGLVLTLTIALVNPARPYIFQYVIDNPVVTRDLHSVRHWMFLAVMLLLGQTVLMYYQTWLTHKLGQLIMNDLRKQIFAHILKLRLQYFDKSPVGTLITRTISDIQTLNAVFSEGVVTIVGELLQLIAILFIMFYTSWQLTLITLAILPLLLLATQVFRVKVKVAFENVRKYVAEMNTFLQEHITGNLITQLFSRENNEYKTFEKVNANHRDAHLNSVLYYSIFFPVIEIIAALAIAVIVWYGAGSVLDGNITFGVLVAFLLYIQMFFRPIRMLADQFNTLQMGVVSAERIFKVLDTNEFIDNHQNGLSTQNLQGKPVSIEFQNVNFEYIENQPVLNNISFQVNPATTTAIVGATGGGKSSIINTLMRFYEIQNGNILINGKDTREYQLDELRNIMGLVLQDVFLFSGTIMDNITLQRKNIPFEHIQNAVNQVGANKFIDQLPGKYYFRVGERGASLSTGQRQLLAFVRVLLFNPSILLLDEATANIDTETETVIQQAIQNILKNRTAIIVAHRLSTIQQANQILVIHKGNIAEKGNHQELLTLKGNYFKLYQLQYANKKINVND